MKNLISYVFIIFISLNLIISLYGWWQSNKETGIPYNEHTEIIDTIWQTKTKTESNVYINDNILHIDPPKFINRIQIFINAVINANPAFQHTYIEIYGYLHRLFGRNYLEDNNKNNDIVRLPNGQLEFIGKLHNSYTSDNSSNDLPLATEQLKYFKDYIRIHSPKTELYFIVRPNKTYGELPYNLRHQTNHKYTTTDFINDIKALNYHVLDLNNNIPTDRHIAFYNTDHHWRVEYAFSQLPIICNFMGIESSIYSSRNFKLINTKRQFTGSLTKRTGNNFTTLKDTFKYYIPLFDTNFTADYYSNNKIIRRKGKLEETLLFTENLSSYNWDNNLYRICNQSENPLVHIINHNTHSNQKILLLIDSFSAPIIPYLAISYKQLDCIDLRSCKIEVLHTMIKKNQYNKILLLYTSFYDKNMYCFK